MVIRKTSEKELRYTLSLMLCQACHSQAIVAYGILLLKESLEKLSTRSPADHASFNNKYHFGGIMVYSFHGNFTF